MIQRIKEEPAVVIGIILSILKVWAGLTEDQVETVRTALEAIGILIGSGVIRQLVSPIAKLRRQGRA